MENSARQVEKNVAASFAYVKKDVLMLNDSYTNMQDAINQMADSYKILAEEIKELRKDVDNLSPKKTVKIVKKVVKKTVKKTTTPNKDKISLIEGIGPVIENLLAKNKITTFKVLSNTSTPNLRAILDKEGPRFKMHDPNSWARQAKLAANGKWKDLEKLQKELMGGIKVAKTTKNAPNKSVKKTTKKVDNKGVKKIVKEVETTTFE